MGIAASIREDINAHSYNELTKLSEEKQNDAIAFFNAKKKSKSLGIVLAIMGLHYVYLGKWGLFAVYFLTCYGLMLWWAVDLFRINDLIRKSNDDILLEAIASIR